MIGIFTIFYGVGYYPTWLLILIAASFIQFLASSQYTKKIYDPVGRYLGSTLYIGAVLTLIYPIQEAFIFVQYAFAGFFLVSLISRIISLTRKQS
jgi:CDP-diacylglycerol--glycerol-3-phosphate 3-phosphatidyltransferase/cardiolipin synthase